MDAGETKARSKEELFLDEISQYVIDDGRKLKRKTLEECAELIKDFYKNNYRHKYSKIAEYINKKFDFTDSADYAVDSCKELIKAFSKEDNIKLLNDNTQSCDSIDTNRYIIQLNKLIDHIELERFRSNEYNEFDSKLADASERIEAERNKVLGLSSQAESLKDKLDKQELGFVSVLGVFAGIVMAFAGTFTLIGNAIASLNVFNVFNISFTSVLLGLVLSDVLFVLFQSISRILNRNLYQIWTVIVVNLVFILLLIILLVCRRCDIF
jgi:hypothetical protein